MSYTWAEFKAAVDVLLLVNADREGTNTVKPMWVRQAVMRLQRNIPKYRVGHQTLIRAGDATANGQASQGSLPENCEPREAWLLREHAVALGAITIDNLYTFVVPVPAHGITAATSTADLARGYFISAGYMPEGITPGASYYLRVVDADNLTLHTTEAGALNDTGRVEITSDGSGVTTLYWGQQRWPCDAVPWKERHGMIFGQQCVNNQHGVVAFDVNGLSFLVFPRLQASDDDGYAHSVEVNWDGVKTDFEDADMTTFDEAATSAVAEFVQSQFYRHVDRDLAGSEMAEKDAKRQAAGCYLDAKRRGELKP